MIANLLLKYKTDKNYGTIVPHLGHCYGDSYDEIFSEFNKNAGITILEIGIQKGGSLCAWQDYFKNAHIIGVDIVDEILPEYKRKDIRYIIQDIKQVELDINFDIIIDDGSHMLSDVLFVVRSYLSKLNKGGVLIIEDCQEPESWVAHITNIIETHPEYTLTTRDLRGINGHYDDFLIVINRS